MKTSRLLVITSIVFYVFYDIVSTIAAYHYLGTFEYERSTLIRAAFYAAGLPGFVSIKVIVSTAAILAAYVLMERYRQFRGMGAGILAGATCAGIFVGTSNLNILLNGSSIWLLGLDSGTVATLIICGSSAAGLFAYALQRGTPAAG